MKIIDAVFWNPDLRIQIPRKYGYALYEHDEEHGDTVVGPFRFRRIAGYEGEAWENVLSDDGHLHNRKICGFCGHYDFPALYVPSAEEGDSPIPVCEVCAKTGMHEKYSAVSYSSQLLDE